MLPTYKKAWIEPTGSRFCVITEGTLFPGYQNRLGKTWAQRFGAKTWIIRNGYELQEGACPLPVVSDATRMGYRVGLAFREHPDAAKVLTDALDAMQEMIDKALPKFNWGASALDADAIRLLNETPGKVARARELMQQATKP